MNLVDDIIPRGGALQDAQPPGDRPASADGEQGPLGVEPSYDDLIGTAIDYTFPCSDPIAAGCCDQSRR